MKTNPRNPQEDLQAIRAIMERSSKFLSLSGISGILAGAVALLGAAVAWFVILGSQGVQYSAIIRGMDGSSGSPIAFYLALDALLVLVLSVSGAVYFSFRKARSARQELWVRSTRQLLVHLIIPLFTGGIFILILLFRGNPELIVPAMLIFYGLALVNAGKFTFGEIQSLGVIQIGLGLLAGFFVNHGLLLWATGFGLMHIMYGTLMYFRHEHPRKQMGIGHRA
jgi:hypothetical protein